VPSNPKTDFFGKKQEIIYKQYQQSKE